MKLKTSMLRFLSLLVALMSLASFTGCKPGEEISEGVYKVVEKNDTFYQSDDWGKMKQITFWGLNILIPEDYKLYEPTEDEKANNSYWQYDMTYYKDNTSIAVYVIGAGRLNDTEEVILKQKSGLKEGAIKPQRIVVEEDSFFYYQFKDNDQYGIFKEVGDRILFIWIISDIPKDAKDNERSPITLEMARQIESTLTITSPTDSGDSTGSTGSKSSKSSTSPTSETT